MRLDDVLLAAPSPPVSKPVHYILHTTFCCSTLLARYFEILPSCFVLKEPVLLTQLGVISHRSVPGWEDGFTLALQLLTRTYQPGQMAVIKAHEPCNVLGPKLLEENAHATITFMNTDLRSFLLAVLKSQERRDWVRARVSGTMEAAACPALAHINARELTVPQSAACLWLVSRFLCKTLSSGPHRSRVLVLDGDRLASSPETALPDVVSNSRLSLTEEVLKGLLEHPTARRYSKGVNLPYDVDSRRKELIALECSWGSEADAGLEWAERHGGSYLGSY